MRVIIFFTIFILVFGSMGTYLYNRISNTFSGTFLASKAFLGIYIFLLTSFIFGKLIENYSINFLSESLVKVGSYGLGVFFYALLAFIFFDILRLINHILPFYPAFIKNNLPSSRLIIGSVFAFAISLLVGYGVWNSFQPRVKSIPLSIDKKVAGMDHINIVAVSDIHLGTMVNQSKVKRLIREIKDLKPDLVLIAGDIVDNNIEVVRHYKLIEYFQELNPKFGVFGIMGNHEYIGKSYSDIPYYEQNNIKMLIDSSVLVEDKFYIIGRDDLQARALFNRKRKSLEMLTTDLDKSKPVILLDHQPYDLEASSKSGIDLHFSGHTHHGQFWPLSAITNLLFEKDWGYLLKGQTHYYISCGYGTAGPPIRIGSHPEIVNFKIKFN